MMHYRKIFIFIYKTALFAGIILTLFACTRYIASYDLYIRGSLDKETPAITGKRVLVYTKRESRNLILEMETAAKIIKALTAHGYTPVENLQNADYVLLFEYGIDSGKAVSSTESGYELNTFTKRFEQRRSTTTETEYTKHLILRLFSAKKLTRTSQPVWTGEVRSTGTGSNLREAIDYLVVAAFEHFGEETAEDIMLTINSDDERLKTLSRSIP
jgi:ADP-heptose:LPS heptosyltransferase